MSCTTIRLQFVVSLLCLLTSSHHAAAQVELERFYPAAVQPGTSSTVKAEGKFPTWPVQAKVDRPGIIVTAAKENGTFKIDTTPEVAPGIAWVRLYDAVGAANLAPLLIMPAPVVMEVEPNDQLSNATSSELPFAVAGKLEKSGDVDVFKVKLSAGQTLVAQVIANRILKSPMDAVLQLTDAKGNVLFQADDVRGLDPRIVHTTKEAGEYFLRVFAFPETPNSTIGFAGASNFAYVIESTAGPYLESVIPLALSANAPLESFNLLGWNLSESSRAVSYPGLSAKQANIYVPGAFGWQLVPTVETNHTLLTDRDTVRAGTRSAEVLAKFPIHFSGTIEKPKEVDSFPVTVKSGKKYRIEAHSRSLGFPVDSSITINGRDGKELASNDDASRNNYDAAVEFTANEDGPVTISVRDITDAFSTSHIYVLRCTEVASKFAINVDADHFTVNAGSTVDIPVTVTREGGMAGDIEISMSNLPGGVTCPSVTSLSKGDTSKKVVLKLTATDQAAGHGTMRIQAKEVSPNAAANTPIDATFALSENHLLSDFWLTIAPKKADAK